MNIIEIPSHEISRIEPLWNELNAHHLQHSSHFKHHFKHFSFQQRCQALIEADQLMGLAAQEQEQLVAYCIASIVKSAGEIDSIYAKKQARGCAIGSRLSTRALDWLVSHNCQTVRVAIAEGNESALPFYRQLGFKERFTVMQLD